LWAFDEGQAQVAVVADHDGGIDASRRAVDEQAGGDVDVGSLLLTPLMRHDEAGVQYLGAVPALDRCRLALPSAAAVATTS
jgi:hypothetical protein